MRQAYDYWQDQPGNDFFRFFFGRRPILTARPRVPTGSTLATSGLDNNALVQRWRCCCSPSSFPALSFRLVRGNQPCCLPQLLGTQAPADSCNATLPRAPEPSDNRSTTHAGLQPRRFRPRSTYLSGSLFRGEGRWSPSSLPACFLGPCSIKKRLRTAR